jgi:hypothetical protein
LRRLSRKRRFERSRRRIGAGRNGEACRALAGQPIRVNPPVVTYLFTLEYLGVTWAIAALMLSKDGITIESLRQIMDGEFMAMYSAMISFWFGNRVFGKRKT